MRFFSTYRALATVLLFAAVCGVIGLVHAQRSGTSGDIYWGNVDVPSIGNVPIYLTSEVSPGSRGAFNASWAFAGKPPNEIVNMPVGWMRANVAGFMDGGYCGETGWIVSDTAIGRAEDYLCFDFLGEQTYFSMAYGSVWNGNGYTDFGPQRSPDLVR